MIKYQVRSRDLLDISNDIKNGKLIISPYFQRNLVWRDLHKKDFIETILKGYPFPQIFIARGDIDVENMTSQSCVVDGQQRMNSIREFLEDKFPVNGLIFSQLSFEEKQNFLTYQVPVIDLDIRADDPAIIDIFTRLNRTFYSLSTIEKMATEYSTVDLMLVAKFLCGLIDSEKSELDDGDLTINPNMPEYFSPWAKSVNVEEFKKYILESEIFTPYETSRMVHLMYTLNLLATIMCGFYNRNDKAKELLENDEIDFTVKSKLTKKIELVAQFYNSIEFNKKSIWRNKSNSFSLLILFFWNFESIKEIGIKESEKRLLEFENSIPPDYSLAAREGVNNKKERLERHKHLAELFGVSNSENSLLN